VNRSIVVAAVAAALLCACGQSKQDKAQSQVCSARADIKKQVDVLSNMTASTFTLDGVKSSLQSISGDVKQIASAQGDLSGNRRDQVKQANATFKGAVQDVRGSLLQSLSLSGAKQQLKTAASHLQASYKQALAPIDCSS
jgi:outer membrane protein TolC